MKYIVDLLVTSRLKVKVEADDPKEAYRMASTGGHPESMDLLDTQIKDVKVVSLHNAKNLRKKAGAKQ